MTISIPELNARLDRAAECAMARFVFGEIERYVARVRHTDLKVERLPALPVFEGVDVFSQGVQEMAAIGLLLAREAAVERADRYWRAGVHHPLTGFMTIAARARFLKHVNTRWRNIVADVSGEFELGLTCKEFV